MFNTSFLPYSSFSSDFSLTIKRFDYKNYSYEVVIKEKHICVDPLNVLFNQIHSEVTFGYVIMYPEYNFHDIFYEQTNINQPFGVMSGFIACVSEYIHEKRPETLTFIFLESDYKLFKLIKKIHKTKYSQMFPQYEWDIIDNFDATKIILSKKLTF